MSAWDANDTLKLLYVQKLDKTRRNEKRKECRLHNVDDESSVTKDKTKKKGKTNEASSEIKEICETNGSFARTKN